MPAPASLRTSLDAGFTIPPPVSHGVHRVLEPHAGKAAALGLAQAGYVGDRQMKQLQVMNVNVGVPGGGTASQPLYQAFGRPQLRIDRELRRNSYDSLQPSYRGPANGIPSMWSTPSRRPSRCAAMR